MIFKIRCSAIGQIMTEPRSKSETLSQTCKTYLNNWRTEIDYGISKQFRSKYTDKGNMMEADAIAYLSEIDGVAYDKNEFPFWDDDITGTPDIITDSEVIDIKCSWDPFTFPRFDTEPDKVYVWQLQGYMALTDKTQARLCYVLTDTPDFLIDREARRVAFDMGMDEVPSDLFDEVAARMRFSHHPTAMRLKTFTIARDEAAIQAIRERVKQCREYLNTAFISPTI